MGVAWFAFVVGLSLLFRLVGIVLDGLGWCCLVLVWCCFCWLFSLVRLFVALLFVLVGVSGFAV